MKHIMHMAVMALVAIALPLRAAEDLPAELPVFVDIAEQAGLDTALRFADRIDDELNRLADLGHAGVAREWLSPGLRLTMIGNYSVYFRVTATATVIVRFLRGSRDIADVDFGSPESGEA